jgi:hypothetical protein
VSLHRYSNKPGSHVSATAVHMGVPNEYRNQLLGASLKRRLGDDWDVTS